MLRLDRPATQAEITKEAGLEKQRVSWHLPRMVTKGLVLVAEHDGRAYYGPQPILQSKEILDVFYMAYRPLLDAGDPVFDFEQAGIDAREVIRNNFLALLGILEIDVVELLGENGKSL